MIGLLIVDDHPVVRDGLRGMFAGDERFRVLGEAADGREALAVAAAVQPDVVLMDLRMPGMDGVTAIRAGATGYLLKDTPREELFRAVSAAHRGESVLSPAVAGRLMGELRSPAREELSRRELEVLGLIAQGCGNRETATRLFISEATVKTHLLHAYAKLGVRDRAAAVAAAYARGLLGSGSPR